MNHDEVPFDGLPTCPVHGIAHRPALCRTDRIWHPVVCTKPKRTVQQEGRLGYGTHTLPKEFWTA